MKRKILSLILTLVLCAGFAVPVSAAEKTITNASNTITILGFKDETVVEVEKGTGSNLETVSVPLYRISDELTPWGVEDCINGNIIFSVRGLGYDIGETFFSLTDESITSTTDNPSSWASEQVNAAITAALVPESLQSKYTQAATRAEFAALAVTLYETVMEKEIATNKSIAFTDTMDINVYKAAAIGVVTGTGDNKFEPDNTLTREQAATMLSRLAAAMDSPLTGQGQGADFADNADISDWAVGAVKQSQAAGIMDGVGDNKFDPQGAYTREQSITTIMRLFDVVKQ